MHARVPVGLFKAVPVHVTMGTRVPVGLFKPVPVHVTMGRLVAKLAQELTSAADSMLWGREVELVVQLWRASIIQTRILQQSHHTGAGSLLLVLL